MEKRFQIGTACLLLGALILSACGGSATEAPTQPAAASTQAVPATLSPSDPGPAVQPSVTPAQAASQPTRQPAGEPLSPVGGIEMHQINPRGGLEVVTGAGAHWVRRNGLRWSIVEPQEGTRDWTAVAALEQEMVNASEAGLELILIIRSAPAWAQKIPGVGCGPVAADKFQAFGLFMKDLVTRYSAPPYNVRYYELGNEPDIDPGLVAPELDSIYGCWGDPADAYYGGGHYGQMLQQVYPAVKEANPEAQVMIGSLLLNCSPDNPPQQGGQTVDCTPGRFLEGILQAGGGDYFDAVGFHAYDYYYGIYGSPTVYGNTNWFSDSRTTGPSLIGKTRFLREVLMQFGVEDKALFNTESAIICTGSDSECLVDDLETVKAHYAAQAYAAAAAEGLAGNIWYSITGWRHSGMVGAELAPRPVIAALTVSLEALDGSGFVREITEFPEVMGYEFEKEGQRWWIIWSLSPEGTTVSLPSNPQSVRDVYGETLAEGAELALSLAPVYLTWGD